MSEPLKRLKTDLGERSTYDAVSQCSRCGYCEQACPTYVATGDESKSGRGRNQLVRLLLEGRLKDPEAAREALSTCLLCGACQTACYAHVPVPDLVLEGQRLLDEKPPWLARALTRLLVDAPERLELLLKAGYLMKRLGLSRLARPFLRLLGLAGLAEADEHLDEVPGEFLKDRLTAGRGPQGESWSYFAPCGPNYVLPGVGEATLRALSALEGPGRLLEAGCCGLLPYNYGGVEDARALARGVIEAAERQSPGASPVAADCSSCVAFLKSYPQLFLDDPAWKARAERFAARVRDAVEILDRALPRLAGEPGTVVYHEACRARHGQGLKPPARALESACGEVLKPLEEADACCGGAGAFAFVHPELSDQVLRRKISRIAQSQARVVLASSTSCLLQLAHGLKKYYPECRAMHPSELAARALAAAPIHGTKTGA